MLQEQYVKANLKAAVGGQTNGLEAERQAFEKQRPKLMQRYPGQYVAIAGGRVLDHDKDDEKLAARMFLKLGDAPFYIARVEKSPTIFELPSPELAG